MGFSRLRCVVLAALLLACLSATGNATLIVQSIVSTPLSYDAVVRWESGGNSIETLTALDLGITPWNVGLVANQLSGQVFASAAHYVGPHGEPSPNPNVFLILITSVTAGIGSGTNFDSQSHAPHADTLFVSVTPLTATAAISEINISARHVAADTPIPEPSTTALAAVGLAVLPAIQRRVVRRRSF